MVIFGHRRGGSNPPPPKKKKSRNNLFLGKIFKFQGGGGPDPRSPPLDPRMVSEMPKSADFSRQLLALEIRSFVCILALPFGRLEVEEYGFYHSSFSLVISILNLQECHILCFMTS